MGSLRSRRRQRKPDCIIVSGCEASNEGQRHKCWDGGRLEDVWVRVVDYGPRKGRQHDVLGHHGIGQCRHRWASGPRQGPSLVKSPRRKLGKVGKFGLILVGTSSLLNVLYANASLGRGSFFVALLLFFLGVTILAIELVRAWRAPNELQPSEKQDYP